MIYRQNVRGCTTVKRVICMILVVVLVLGLVAMALTTLVG